MFISLGFRFSGAGFTVLLLGRLSYCSKETLLFVTYPFYGKLRKTKPFTHIFLRSNLNPTSKPSTPILWNCIPQQHWDGAYRYSCNGLYSYSLKALKGLQRVQGVIYGSLSVEVTKGDARTLYGSSLGLL